MSNEQWLENGDCSKCRRRNYCKKRCKKSREALRSTIAGLLETAMAKRLAQENKDDVVVSSESAQAQYLEKQLEK